MILDELRTFELSQTYMTQRLADAAHERLLLEAERAAGLQPTLTMRLGSTLIRAGQRLEALGGAPQPKRQLTVSGYSA